MVSRRPSGILREGSQGSHQEGAHLIKLCSSWSIRSSASQSIINWRSGEDHRVKVGHWTQVRSGQLKARFVGKGYTQIIDKETKYNICSYSSGHDTQDHTSHESDSSIKSLCVRCGFSVSQYANWWIKRIHSCSGTSKDWAPRTHSLETQASALWSQRFTEIMADDLVVAGEAQAIQEFIQEIQKTFSLRHVDYLTPDNAVEFLGRIIKVEKSGQITMEFHQKLVDNHLSLFEVKGRSTTNGIKIQQISKEDQISCEKEVHSKLRTATGKLLWMSQLRDDIKVPVKELSRSLINPQDVDFDNLIHLLKYVNQTRDYVYVMDPHIPTADSQGFIPVEVVSYSDSDWAGCQRSRRSTSGSLITLFSVNLSSTSRTQASVSHSSAEAELYAMTQAAVASLAIKHFTSRNWNRRFFPEKWKSLSRQIHQQAKQWPHVWAFQGKSISNSDNCGFRTFSAKESCHSKKWELTTTPQMFSGSLFSLECWAIIFPSLTFSKILQWHCLRCPRLALMKSGSHLNAVIENSEKVM